MPLAKYYNLDLPNNLEFIRRTMLVAMEDSTHPKVDEWAEKLWLAGGPRAIFDFCHHNLVYCKDSIIRDTLRKPHVLLERVEGGQYPHKILDTLENANAKYVYMKTASDCDDKSCMCAALLMNRGYKVRLVAAHHIQPVPVIDNSGKQVNKDGIPVTRPETPEEMKEINHVYLEMKDEDQNPPVWIPLEPSSKSVGWNRVAPGVLVVKYVYPEIGGEVLERQISKKKVLVKV